MKDGALVHDRENLQTQEDLYLPHPEGLAEVRTCDMLGNLLHYNNPLKVKMITCKNWVLAIFLDVGIGA